MYESIYEIEKEAFINCIEYMLNRFGKVKVLINKNNGFLTLCILDEYLEIIRNINILIIEGNLKKVVNEILEHNRNGKIEFYLKENEIEIKEIRYQWCYRLNQYRLKKNCEECKYYMRNEKHCMYD